MGATYTLDWIYVPISRWKLVTAIENIIKNPWPVCS